LIVMTEDPMAQKRNAAQTAYLTKTTVDKAHPKEKRYFVWDTDLSGFGLRVEPSGSKTYVIRYRAGGGRRGTQQQFKIGTHGKLTAAQARDRARDLLAQVELGQDPQQERSDARKELTVPELCALYFAEGCATKKASTLKLDKIRVEGHIKPLLGKRKLAEVGRADIERMRDAIADCRVKPPADDDTAEVRSGSRVRGGKTASTKTVKLLRAIYNFAMGRKLCRENPCAGVETYADKRRERFLSPAELATLGDVLAAAEAERDPKGRRKAHVRIIRLLALTGARKNEIARLRWSEVKEGYLQLEDSKTGRKAVPLGEPALELLKGIKRGNSPWVFPDPENPEEPIRNLDYAWVVIRERGGLEDVRIHDLRHSYASMGVAGGDALFLIGKVLGHANSATTQRYAHLADDPVKAAADRISKAMSDALAGGPSGGSAA
jgi:integrase